MPGQAGRDGRDTFSACTAPPSRRASARPSPAARIRLFNQDIIDLTNRAPVGTHVTVVQG
jgi:hypothetical protein